MDKKEYRYISKRRLKIKKNKASKNFAVNMNSPVSGVSGFFQQWVGLMGAEPGVSETQAVYLKDIEDLKKLNETDFKHHNFVISYPALCPNDETKLPGPM